MTTDRYDVAVVGSGFAGSLLARILATLGYSVALIERGSHPRFAIGESSTPLANLTLERLAARYGLEDCYELATHGRWLASRPQLMRGLKRGFTYYRHRPGEAFAARGGGSDRLIVAASPDDAIADTHWLRADVDHHFVREAIAAGVDYRERVELTTAGVAADGVALCGRTGDGEPISLNAGFVVDATGPGGFLARQLAIPSGLEQTSTRSALLFSHFDGVGLMGERYPQFATAPYPEDWAAVHHIIDEGWMYSLRFDDGVTSAGFLLSPRGTASLSLDGAVDTNATWRRLVDRYPTIGELFAGATPRFPIAFIPRIQHRLARAVGDRWAVLPHAYAFVDPLYSTGIAWGLRGVERLADAFSEATGRSRVPSERSLARYDALLAAEADQVDRLVAGAYEAMTNFDLFAAHSMLYFATVSYAEVSQRFAPDESWAWSGFLGVGDSVCDTLFAESLGRLRELAQGATPAARHDYAEWVAEVIAPRNIAGLADVSRRNVYPVDLDVLVERHALLGLSREQVVERLPLLRGGVLA